MRYGQGRCPSTCVQYIRLYLRMTVSLVPFVTRCREGGGLVQVAAPIADTVFDKTLSNKKGPDFVESRYHNMTGSCESGARVQFQLLFPSSWHRVQGKLWDPALQ